MKYEDKERVKDLLLTSGQIEELLNKRGMIPDEFWRETETNRERLVLWLVNRQIPSVQADYSFDEERLGITKDGKIIFGFDSGCSCPSPWHDCGDGVYTIKTWKEFNIDPGAAAELEWDKECVQNVKDLLMLVRDDIKPEEVFSAKNTEIRRHLMKRVGFENIRKLPNFRSLAKDGKYELFALSELEEGYFKIPIPRADGYIKDKKGVPFVDKPLDTACRNTELYVKVPDSSSDREYCLYLGGLEFDSRNQVYRLQFKTPKDAVAWTFGLKPEEYNPKIET